MLGMSNLYSVTSKQERQNSRSQVLLGSVGSCVVGLLWFAVGADAVNHHRSPWFAWILGTSFLLLGAFWSLRFRRSTKAGRLNGSSVAPGA